MASTWPAGTSSGRKPGFRSSTVLGGRLHERVPTAGGLPIEGGDYQDERLAEHRANGCGQFSAKASGDPDTDIGHLLAFGEKMRPGESIKLDANGGWRVDEAIRVMQATRGIDVYFEQPCATYEDCRSVRRVAGARSCWMRAHWTSGPSYAVGMTAYATRSISRSGGSAALGPHWRCAIFASALAIPVYVQCTGGSNVTQAAIVHLAQSTPRNVLLSIWDIGDLVGRPSATDPIERIDGHMAAHDAPGLGVTPRPDILGDPVAVYE